MSHSPLPAAASGGVSSAEIEEFSSRLALLDGVGDDIEDRERIRSVFTTVFLREWARQGAPSPTA